jgi:hypothetical protein
MFGNIQHRAACGFWAMVESERGAHVQLSKQALGTGKDLGVVSICASVPRDHH